MPSGKINLERDELSLRKLQKTELKNLLRRESLKTQDRDMLIPRKIIVSGIIKLVAGIVTSRIGTPTKLKL